LFETEFDANNARKNKVVYEVIGLIKWLSWHRRLDASANLNASQWTIVAEQRFDRANLI
jgi:hypothetical protein